MSNYPERFESRTIRCATELDHTVEQTIQDRDGTDRLVERPARCDTELTFADHYVGKRRLDGYTEPVPAVECPECGEAWGVCPVCTDEDGGPGYFLGESSGDVIPCHVCNQAEIDRRMKRKGRV